MLFIRWLWWQEGVLFSFLQRRVVEEFLDEVHVAEEHPAAAVPLETEGVEGVASRGSFC